MSKTGTLPDSWTVTRVDRVGSVRAGLPRSPDRQTGRYRTKYLRSANITPTGLDLSDLWEMDFTPEERATFSLLPGDIVLTEASGSSAQVGRAAIWPGTIAGCCYQNHLVRFRPHAALSEYALLVFRHYAVAGVFARTARGVGIQHLGVSRFAALPFPVPPLSEQRRIAKITTEKLEHTREAADHLRSAIDGLSEQTREIVSAATAGTLLEPRQGDHTDKVTSVETHRPSSKNYTTLASSLKRLPFNRIPIRWNWTTIDEVGEVRLGRQRSPSHHHGPNMRPYLRVANVFEDHIDTADVFRMNFEPHEAAAFELRSGDILLNEGQSPDLVGRAAIYRGEIPGACFQNTLIRFRAGPDVEPEFALLVFRQYLHAGIFRGIARWSTNIAHLGLKRFRALPFPLPPLQEQKRIAEDARRRLEATANQASALQASLANVPGMERELLAAATTGEMVPQDPSDEAADALLKRLGPPPVVPRVRRLSKGGTDVVSAKVKSSDHPTGAIIDLGAVLRAAGGSLTLPELFARAGFDRDSTEAVERFYLALRSQVGPSLRVRAVEAENVVVEISDAD